MSTEAPNPISTPDQPAASPLKRQLPNIITSIRMLMVVAFAALLEATPSGPNGPDAAALLAAAGLFVVAALSDALDGHLARRWNVISRFGRIMDPLADKLLVLTAFMYLASPLFEVDGMMLSRVAPWMVAVILGRELAVTSLRGMLEADGVDASASTAGKLKMVLQSICIPGVLVLVATTDAGQGTPAGIAIVALVWGTVFATAASAWPYIRAAVRHTRTA